jgi:trimethylamine-N-oxide reductase (cytochrome c)
MPDINIADSSVIKSIGFSGFGSTSNVSRVDVRDGKIVRIRPLHYTDNYTEEDLNAWRYEKDGKVFKPGMKSLIPPFTLAYKTRTYSKNRVPAPLIREDWDPNGERNPQNRGISKYRRISWDEATSIIAAEIERIHKTYGPFSIYCQGEGHGETKNYNGSHGCMIPLLNMIGGCTVQARQPDSWEGWYWGGKHMWGMEPIGLCNQTNGVFRDITQNGDAVLYWGCDPETTPWGWSGQQASRLCYWLNDINVKSIFICPDVNYGGAVHADKWIPVLPNTDSALQLAIAHTWLTENTYDKQYLETHAVGFDWFENYVLGYLDGVAKTPAWAAEKCGVKSYHIKALARYWAKHNVSIAHGNGGGYIRSVFAHEPARLEISLLGMQALGKPGRHQFRYIEWTLMGINGFSPLPLSETYTVLDKAYHGWNFELGAPNAPESFIAKTKLHHAILEKESEWFGRVLCIMPREDQFNHFNYPMPEDAQPIHMIWSDTPCWSACWNNGYLYQDAMRDESIEFVLIQHPWLENDTLFADIILPAATMMECYDIGNDNFSGQWGLLYVEEQAIEPVGEAKSDYHVVLEVARALEKRGGTYQALAQRYSEGLTQDEKIRQGFEFCGKPDDLTFEQLREQGFWASPTKDGWQDEPAGLLRFYEDPESFPLQSPTGKIEYYSTTLASQFPDDKIRAPYPQWVEESDEHHERISSDRAKDYPFLLVSNHPHWRVHANHDDIPWTREIETCKVKGPDGYLYEPLWINPRDARLYDIRHGDIVKIFNERGSVLGGAYVTERIMAGVLYQDHGVKIDAIVRGVGGLDRSGSNNLIAPDGVTSPNCAGEVTNGYLVGVAKVDVFEIAEQYPEQFNRDYDAATGLLASAYIIDEKG